MESPQLAVRLKLEEAFSRARVKNPAYSLRAFSRKLKIGPSALSEILNGKRKVSKNLADKLLTQLALEPGDTKTVLSLFDKDKSSNLIPLNSQEEITADQFKVIGEWYHFAILSLMETKGAKWDATWIAKRLSLRIPDVTAALERMERVGLIRRSAKGELSLTGASFKTPDGIASTAIRRAHNFH